MRFGIKGKDATKIHFNKYVNQLINHPSREVAWGTDRLAEGEELQGLWPKVTEEDK